jgi:NADH-quinone oxidoreductase subunit C
MDKIQLTEFLKSIGQDLEVKEGKQYIEVTVPPSKLYSLAAQLSVSDEVRFDFLFCLSGVDYGQDLGVVYHLRSTVFDHVVVLKTRTSDREHLLGIKFNNHPDLRRLFLDNSWGFPLRKDYVDDINIVTK